jgi:hypothetical protein
MPILSSIAAFSRKALPLLAMFAITIGAATAGDETKYPDLRGQWSRIRVPGVAGQPSFDPTKPWAKGQQAPLTPEYQVVLEANLTSQAASGVGDYQGVSCLGWGMPVIMYGVEPLEFVVTPETTYVLVNWVDHGRRIYTDGRDWPQEIEPTLAGYSIGMWIDEDHDGRYDVLEVETRGFRGPRHYDAAGLPMHHDNESVFKERIYLDKIDKNILHDEITVIDHALTRPWTVTRDFRRNPDARPTWREFICAQGNLHVTIGTENYFISGDGLLMPARKDQAPPDLRYFKQTRK